MAAYGNMRIMKMQSAENTHQKMIRISCGEYTANLVFREKCDTDVMIPIKELIMSAYDLRKQQEERKTG